MFLTLMGEPGHAALLAAANWLESVAGKAAPAAISAVWQGMTLAVVLAISLKLASRIHIHLGAAQRFTVWLAAFAAVAGLPLFPWFSGGAAFSHAAHMPGDATAGAAWQRFPHFQLDDRWALAIVGLWFAATLVRGVRLGVHGLRLRRVWSAAKPVEANPQLGALLEGGCSAGVRHYRNAVELCTTEALDRPAVIGFLTPRILIPEWLYGQLTADELKQVVLHEAEHLRRGDDWSNLLQKLALVLFPLNPALAWIERQLCREREMACDEGVVQRTLAPCAYAACLTSLAERGLERRRGQVLALGVLGSRSELVGRVLSVLARKQALHPRAARAVVGVVACGLLLTSIELVRCPQIVAFVSKAPLPQSLPASMLAQNDRGFRVVEARAALPANSRGAGFAMARSIGDTDRQAAAAPGYEMARTQQAQGREPQVALVKATMQPAEAAGQQVVVLAAWEEVQIAPRGDGVQADYDMGTAAQPQAGTTNSGTSGKNAPAQTMQISVARLVFLVPQPTHDKASSSTLPPAPAPESGWLVLQL